MTRVAVVGNLAYDVIDGRAPMPGGCPFYAAEAFRRLGADGQIVTRYADGDRELFEPALAGLSIRVTLLDAGTTTGFTIDHDGEQRAMGVTAIGDTWRPEDAAALDADIGWVHAAPLLRGDFPAETLEALASGRRLSLDGQGLVRTPRVGPLTLDADFDPAALAHVTALKLSENEGRVVAGRPFDLDAAGRLRVPEVLLTHGSRGVTVFEDGKETNVAAPRPVLGVHATGSGDAFMVAYAVGRTNGRGPVDAAREACAFVGEMLEARRITAS